LIVIALWVSLKGRNAEPPTIAYAPQSSEPLLASIMPAAPSQGHNRHPASVTWARDAAMVPIIVLGDVC